MHQNNIPSSKSHPRTAVQKATLHEKSVTALFWAMCFHQHTEDRMAQAAGTHTAFCHFSILRKVKWKAKEEHWEAGSHRKEDTGERENTKLSVKERVGRVSQRGYLDDRNQDPWE